MENDFEPHIWVEIRSQVANINCFKSENGKKRVIFVTKTCTKYFTMLAYITFNSVTVQIRPIFIYSPLFAGYNELGYTRI